MFVFNAELLLYGVTGVPQALLIFTTATLGACAFGNATMGRLVTRNRWYELPMLLAAGLILFYPALLADLLGLDYRVRYFMYLPGVALYAACYLMQRRRRDRMVAGQTAGP